MTSPNDNDQKRENDQKQKSDLDKIKKIDESQRVLKTITYLYCDIHNIRYPEGARCPRCP